MAENSPVLQQLINSLVYYNTEYRVAICQPCGSVFPKDVATHLRNYHYVFSTSERGAIINYINTLDIRRPENIMEYISLTTEVDAIEGLPIYNLVRCKNCQKLGAESTILAHCQNKHGWNTTQGMSNVYFINDCSNVD